MDPEIEELRGRLDALHAERRSMHEAAGENELEGDALERWDALDTEEAEVREKLAAAEERVERAARVAESRAKWGSLQVGTVVHSDDVDVTALSRGEARDRALKRLESDGKDLRSGSADRVDALLRMSTSDRDADHIARRLLLTENDAYRSAFMKAMTSPTPAFTADEARAVAAMRDFERAMSHTGTSGGFGVPVLIDPTIVLTGQQSANPFRRISRVETITTDKWKGVSSAGVSWSWDAEAAEVSDDSPTLAQPEVAVHSARGFVPFSIEIGQDYPGFANEIGGLLVEGYDELTAQAFAVGSGSGQPFGIVTAIQATGGSTVQHTTAGSFAAVDINKVWGALPDRAKANATWVMNADTASVAAFLGDAFGTRTVDLGAGLKVLRERPVEIASHMPALTTNTTATNGSIVVGDFRRYLIAERVGMSLELVPHLFGKTNARPTGERGYFAFARVGADSIDDGAFRVLENA